MGVLGEVIYPYVDEVVLLNVIVYMYPPSACWTNGHRNSVAKGHKRINLKSNIHHQLIVRLVFVIPVKEWFTVYEHYRRTNCVASDLIMGNEYIFRVFAINMVGPSEEPCTSIDSAYIQKTGDL